MIGNSTRSRVASDPERYERIKAILIRYPHTTAAENADVLMFLRKGPMLDRALLSGVPEIQSQLASFEADHRKDLSITPMQYLFAATLAAAVLLGTYFLWDVAL
jgi:hypothetical protein